MKGGDMTDKRKQILAAGISLLANLAVVSAPHVGTVRGWNTIVRTFKTSEKARSYCTATRETADGGLL